MVIRKAKEADLHQITEIYDRIHGEEESDLARIGWVRGVYPVRETAEDAIDRGDIFVMEEEHRIVAAAIINQTQVPEYKLAGWKYEASDREIMVLHTLTVDPRVKGSGYGKAFVAFYEDYAWENHCPELRMDTNAVNSRARKMYKGLGYEEVGIVPCVFNGIPDIQLVCLEKHLQDSMQDSIRE